VELKYHAYQEHVLVEYAKLMSLICAHVLIHSATVDLMDSVDNLEKQEIHVVTTVIAKVACAQTMFAIAQVKVRIALMLEHAVKDILAFGTQDSIMQVVFQQQT